MQLRTVSPVFVNEICTFSGPNTNTSACVTKGVDTGGGGGGGGGGFGGSSPPDFQLYIILFWERLLTYIKYWLLSVNIVILHYRIHENFSSKVHFMTFSITGQKIFARFARNDHQAPPPPHIINCVYAHV